MDSAAQIVLASQTADNGTGTVENYNGRTIRGYELHSQVGMGGFGVVYRAYQPLIGRDVAIKVVLPRYANHPDFIRRFDVEAQLVARLEHPAIVPLYDYWRDPGGAYLVMRWLRGGSLADVLKPMPIDAIPVLLDQIGAALAVAHRRGIVHRDLKPANILLDEEGNAYLADFGIAKDLGNTDSAEGEPEGSFVGSPSYLSPEQIRAGPISPQTDIYSLGIVLYELLAGTRPFHSSTRAELFLKHLYDPLPPLVVPQRPELASRLDSVLRRATAKSPSERYPDISSMLLEFRRAMGLTSNSLQQPALLRRPAARAASHSAESQTGQSTIALATEVSELENPYKGLRAFQEADAADFFGREVLSRRLLRRLDEPGELARFLALVGPSGSGKSSLIRAGLIPKLRRGALPGSEKWFVVSLTPGSQPLEELERALLTVAVDPPAALLPLIQRDETGLLEAVHRVLPNDQETDLVLIIDQFEELFTLVDDEAVRLHLLKSLRAAVIAPGSRLRVIITMRADFYDRPLLYPGFSEMMRQRTEVVVPLTLAELEQAIECPAQRVGVTAEPALIATIIDEFGQQPGGLPLLQYALTELFERRTGHMLTLAIYKQSGGVLEALVRRADEVYGALRPEEQEAARQIFLRLVTPGEGAQDTRRRVLRTELAALGHSSAVIERVINAFSAYRLLTLDRDPATRSPTVEVAHEALIRTWQQLRSWIEISRQHLRVQRRLFAAATEWNNTSRDPSFLATGARLAQFEALASESDLALSQIEIEYLQASMAERRRRAAIEQERQAQELVLQKQAADHMRYLVVVLALFLIVAIGLSLFAFDQREQAQRHASEARIQQAEAIRQREQAVAQRLATEARVLMQVDGDRMLAALLSIRSMLLQYSSEGDEALLKAATLEYPLFVPGGHSGEITDVAFAADGSYLLTGSKDGTARLWDAQTGQHVQTFTGHKAAVSSVTFSSDGAYVLTGSADGTARLWDTKTGRQLRQFSGHNAPVTSVAFSSSNSYVLTGSEDTTARLWDPKTGQQLRQFIGHDAPVTSVAFSSSGTYVLTGSEDGTARLWDNHTSRELRQFTAHAAPVVSVAFSPDDSYILTGSEDTTARLWDVQTGEELRKFIGHTGPVTGVGFSPQGQDVLTGSEDKTIQFWDTRTGEKGRTFNAGTIKKVAFSQDGRYVLTTSGSNTAQLWDTQSRAGLPRFIGHTAGVSAARFSPDGNYVLTGSADGTVRLWERGMGRELRRISGYEPASGESIAFAPTGGHIVMVGSDGTASLWNTWMDQELHTLSVKGDTLTSAVFSPDGRALLTGGKSGTAYVWNVQTGQVLFTLRGHSESVTDIAFSPDGHAILTASADGTARLWDALTGKSTHMLKGHTSEITSVAFAPDGSRVLTGSADQTARLWDVQSGELLYVFSGHTDSVNQVRFAPDGRLALTGSADQTARLWDVQSGQMLRVLTGHANAVQAIAFSPDGRYLLTGSADQTARLWDAQSGAEVRRFSGHSKEITSVSFSPDGTYVLTSSNDATAWLWYTDYNQAIQQLCAHLSRDLTQDERLQYDIFDAGPTCPSGAVFQ